MTKADGAEVAVRRWRAKETVASALGPIMQRERLDTVSAGELAEAAIDAFEAAMTDVLPDAWMKYAVPLSEMDGVWRRPDVMGGNPCISGSRIQTKSIWSYFRDGYTTSEIMQEYPTLTAQEIEVAIRFERARRMKRWRSR